MNEAPSLLKQRNRDSHQSTQIAMLGFLVTCLIVFAFIQHYQIRNLKQHIEQLVK